MNLIIGLGNPGERYKKTRHNVGFVMLDRLLRSLGFAKEDKKYDTKSKSEIVILSKLMLAWPQTFMNSSGDAVLALLNYYKIPIKNLYVVHDDLDIRLGDYKIQFGIGPKAHGGILSIEEKLGAKNFTRVRIGIDNRNPDNQISGDEYVLGEFSDLEFKTLTMIMDKIVKDLSKILKLPMK